MVPEERHLLFERTLGVDHMEHPVDVAHGWHTTRQQGTGLVAQQDILIRWRALFRVQQFLYGGGVALGSTRFEFCPGGAETSATHQVRHKCNVIFARHCLSLLITHVLRCTRLPMFVCFNPVRCCSL
jgi:hypothetical protein